MHFETIFLVDFAGENVEKITLCGTNPCKETSEKRMVSVDIQENTH